MKNKVHHIEYEKKSRIGYVDFNNAQRCPVHLVDLSWNEKECRYNQGFGATVANSHNRSYKFTISARTIKQLKNKIEKHEYELVRSDACGR